MQGHRLTDKRYAGDIRGWRRHRALRDPCDGWSGGVPTAAVVRWAITSLPSCVRTCCGLRYGKPSAIIDCRYSTHPAVRDHRYSARRAWEAPPLRGNGHSAPCPYTLRLRIDDSRFQTRDQA